VAVCYIAVVLLRKTQTVTSCRSPALKLKADINNISFELQKA